MCGQSEHREIIIQWTWLAIFSLDQTEMAKKGREWKESYDEPIHDANNFIVLWLINDSLQSPYKLRFDHASCTCIA